MSKENIIESLVRQSIDLAADISPVFADRTDAGYKLADQLLNKNYPNPVLITIPSGGVPLALPIKDRLGLPLHLTFAAKVRFSSDNRFGIGAVSVNGDLILNQELLDDLPINEETLTKGIGLARKIIEEKMNELAPYAPPIPELTGKTVIITEDGIATGFTVMAAAENLKTFKPNSIVIASPVTSNEAYRRLDNCGYEQVTLVQPDSEGFLVDNFYRNFPSISIPQVRQMLAENIFSK